MTTRKYPAAAGRAVNLSAVLVTALLFLPAPVRAADATIKIDNFTFDPPRLTVKAGTTVTWYNEDDIPHTVDSSQGKFKSAALDTDEKFEFKFSEPGEYPFFCRMHPKMTGKVIVQP